MHWQHERASICIPSEVKRDLRMYEPAKRRGSLLTGETPLLGLEGVEDEEGDDHEHDEASDDDADHGGHGHGFC